MRNSKLTFGLWGQGNSEGFHRQMNAREAKNIIKAAYKCGFRSFDTAFSYNTDSLLYSALKEIGIKTEEVEIFEKIMPYKSMERRLEASLRALKRDDVDFLILHWPSSDGNIYESLKAAEKAKEEGKARSIGLSNFPLPLFRKYSLDFDIDANEYYSSPVLFNERIEGVLNLKYGIFSFGTLLKDGIPEDGRKNLYFYSRDAYPKFMDLKNTLLEIAESHGTGIKSILYSFAAYDCPERIIIGAGKAEHLHDYTDAGLSEDEYSLILSKSRDLSVYNGTDNIFCHDWRAV